MMENYSYQVHDGILYIKFRFKICLKYVYMFKICLKYV